MENLRTIEEYIETYRKNTDINLSISAIRTALNKRPSLDKSWSRWLLPDIAFEIDTLVQAQKQLNKISGQDDFDPYSLLESKHVKPMAEDILNYMCDVWTSLDRTKRGYDTWSDYMQHLQKNKENLYKNFINVIVDYIQIRIREMYS